MTATITQLAGNSGGGGSGGGAPGSVFLAGKLIGANLNVTGDKSIVCSGSGKWVFDSYIVTNASVNLTSAQGNLFSQPNQGGAELGGGCNLVNLVNSSTYISTGGLPITGDGTSSNSGSVVINGNSTFYFNVSTPQGATATADIYVYGRLLG